MGLFSKKKKDLDLELPPPPPPSAVENLEMEMPPPPKEMDEEIPVPPKPEEIKPLDLEIPKIHVKEKEIPPIKEMEGFEKELPPVPDLDELKGKLPVIQKLKKQEMPQMGFIPEKEPQIHAGPIAIEERPKRIIKEGPAFVNVDEYKQSIHNINIIKSKMREADNALTSLNRIKNEKDKYFEQFRAKLEDLQRKSLYIDKSLFEVKNE
jgi:hypothetical protein|tara:strand:- start:384 stop:1007 length:624 start_codon:yes stop_codon:yes gene_type:complete